MNTSKLCVTTTLAALLMLAGCSDELSGQAKQAANQIAEEAKKVASQKIEEVKDQAIDQIRQAANEQLATTKGEEKQPADSAEKNQ